MSSIYDAVKISEHVYWVGAIDWSLRNFHGYNTLRGSTYNAYLVMGEKVTLIDAVKKPFKDELLARTSSVIDPSKIDYIVSNHAEMDHSGCLPEIIEQVKPEKVFTSKMGVKTLQEHFHSNLGATAVNDGESVSIGNLDLVFYASRMLHWPESMITYLPADGILFSNDIFGMHLASSERYDDEIDFSVLYYEASKYYANILMPFAHIILKFLEKFQSLNLNLNLVAPDHGPVWRKDIAQIIGLYRHWSEMKPTNKAIVVYDTMWQSTGKMASAINEGLLKGGARTKVMRLEAFDRSDVATEILEAGAIVIGSPNINGTIYPTMADVLTYLTGLKRRNLIGASFGSYGWSPDNINQLNQYLEDMKVEVASPGVKIKFVPDENGLKECAEMGREIGGKIAGNV